MVSSPRFVVLTLVTVLGFCGKSSCASVSSGETIWSGRSVNRAVARDSSNNYVSSNKSRGNSPSSFSIEPYQVHTNGKVVVAKDGDIRGGSEYSGMSVVTDRITPNGVGSYSGFDLSLYQQQQGQQHQNSEKYVSEGLQVAKGTRTEAVGTTIGGEIQNSSSWNGIERYINRNGGLVMGNGQQDYVTSHAQSSNSGKQVVEMGKRREILQRRQDTVGEEDGRSPPGEEEDEHLHYYDHGEEHYGGHGSTEGPTEGEHEHDQSDNENEYYYGHGGNGSTDMQHPTEEDDEEPAIRDFEQGGQSGGFQGPFLSGPGGPVGPFPSGPPPGFGGGPLPPIPGPLPPPPGPLKGSIDYILIPLILIGIAGPIFVVLYVILGGFEYKLAPIARSFKTSYTDYQPYIDNLTTTVGRALEKYECTEYTACRLRGFCNKLGLRRNNANSMERALRSVTPATYMPTVSSFFALVKANKPEDQGNCKSYQCASLIDQLPFKL